MLDPLTPPPPAPARTDDPATFSARADAHVAWQATNVDEMNDLLEALPGELDPANFSSTSSSSVAIGTGTKSFAVEPGKLYFAGQFVIAASAASPTNYMVGQVTSYNSGTGALVLNSLYTSGAGTIASWAIGPSPAPAANVRPRSALADATSGTIAADFDNFDLVIMSGLTAPTTVGAPSAATLASGDKRMLWIRDNGTSRALTWNAVFRAFGSVALPSATTPNKWIKVGLEYNAIDSKFDVIALASEQ